jgi:Ca-activated chloride channel family protein
MRVVTAVLACLMCCGEVSAQALLHSTPSTTEVPPVAIAPAPPTPPPARPVDMGPGVFRSGVDLVSLNVIVTDEKDKFVTGLSQKDFSVFEDGVEQDLSFFAAANVPLDLAILLDSSSSMSDKMSTVHQAAVAFASHLRQGDRIMVVGIKDSVRTLHPLDADVNGASAAIRRATASGSTALYNAVYTTIRQMEKVRAVDGEVRRQAIAVLTDGDDTSSLVTFDDLLALSKQAGIAIYTIALRSPYPAIGLAGRKYFSEGEFAMKALAMETGARSFFPTDISQLAGVYDQITQELSNQYAIGYTSKNPKPGGAFRRIAVRVAESNVRTRTRSGYQATTQPAQVSLNR